MAEKKFFEKGSVIFKEGAWELSMYDIVSGKVGIYVHYGEEDETLLAELTAGRYFGEMAVVDAMPRSATAVALEDTETVVVNSGEFVAFLSENPDKVIDVFQSLSARLRELSKDYIDACAAITDYVQAEDKKKDSTFLGKVKKLFAVYYHYADFVSKLYNFADTNGSYIYF